MSYKLVSYTCPCIYIYIYIYEVMKLHKQVGLKLAQLLAPKDKFVTFDVT